MCADGNACWVCDSFSVTNPLPLQEEASEQELCESHLAWLTQHPPSPYSPVPSPFRAASHPGTTEDSQSEGGYVGIIEMCTGKH